LSKKLHILFLSSWYPSKVSPTNGNFVQKHAEAIATKHKVSVVFAIGDENMSCKYEITNEVLHNVRNIIVYFKKHPYKLINRLRNFIALKKGISLIGNFDIIHGNVIKPIGVFVWWVSKQYKKPFIFTEHWTGYLPQSKISLNIFNLILYKFIVSKAKFIIPVSLELQVAMIAIGLKGTYKVIGNVVDTKLFHPKKNKSSKYTILHVSAFREESKNISGILNVIKELSKMRTDFIFKIVGDGNLSEVQEKIKKLQIPLDNIITEGTKSPSEISAILQNSNLYISFSNYETFGIVMTEAIACGVPVISTNTGILNEMEQLDFVYIINSKDEIALLNNIIQCINSKKILNTRKMFYLIKKQFGVKSIAAQYSQLYAKILN